MAGEIALPSGTVTFLFTDVEDSTRLWESDASHMAGAVERHDELVGHAIRSHGGYVFTTAGDSFAAAFSSASGALAAALSAQASLAAEEWPVEPPVRVRMGLHTGEAFERDGDYFGPAVNRAARVMGCGHGGQVLLSSATASIVGDDSLLELGEHRLRSLEKAERIFQAGDASFPPLRAALEQTHNLVADARDLVGRDIELGQLGAAMAGARLVTLVGPGGVGKTTLVTRFGAEAVDHFPDGVWLVDLAPVTDPGVVPTAVVTALGLRGEGPGSQLRLVVDHLADRQVLLIFDNCEHVIDAAASCITEVLAGCRGVKVLATSREPLHLPAEHVVPLAPLAVGVAGGVGPAVELFNVRAAMAGVAVGSDDGTTQAVEAICRRLDGLPLAIELAAARLRSMSLADLHERLDHRFRLLTGGSRGALPRRALSRPRWRGATNSLTNRPGGSSTPCRCSQVVSSSTVHAQ